MIGGLFPNAWTVAVREYLQRVRSRTFRIVTGVLVLVGLGIALFPVIAQAIGGKSVTPIGVHADDPTLTTQVVRRYNAGEGKGGGGKKK